MKTRVISLVASVAFITGLAVPPSVLASDSSDLTKALAGSTALQLPATAANLVTKAAAADKQAVAVAVVKASVGLNPAATVAIVSAVARDNPSTAPVAAVTAATLQFKQIGLIVKAAVTAAPSEAGNIVAALIKEFPKNYSVIAIAAAEAAPSAGRDILVVLADNVPALQPAIQGAIANFAANDSNIPVLAILSQINNQANSSAALETTQPLAALNPPMITATVTPLLAGPQLVAPFTPVTTINNITSTSTTPQTPSGRTYAEP
jgi:hypothetical protein